jgi:hypothetical protein
MHDIGGGFEHLQIAGMEFFLTQVLNKLYQVRLIDIHGQPQAMHGYPTRTLCEFTLHHAAISIF